uniref:THD domain-containing protein n=1 Tax=Mola mola TaxID=94237 RepID=A0A3Q4AB98_MOLML
MINTYQSSLAPPPLPPRLDRSHPVLIAQPLPSQGYIKPLTHFLLGVVLLHLFLSIGGFIYLSYNGNKLKQKVRTFGSFQCRHGSAPLQKQNLNTASLLFSSLAAYHSSERQVTNRILARMAVEQQTHKPGDTPTSGYLQWNIKFSFQRDISYYHKIWLTVLQPGDYYVYSRVTFSMVNSQIPLASMVKLRKNETDKRERTVMQAYCSGDVCGAASSVPHLCTASQGEVITVETGNQLSVWVPDLTRVNYEESATTFGMYKL